jgi:hypothetical protein
MFLTKDTNLLPLSAFKTITEEIFVFPLLEEVKKYVETPRGGIETLQVQ